MIFLLFYWQVNRLGTLYFYASLCQAVTQMWKITFLTIQISVQSLQLDCLDFFLLFPDPFALIHLLGTNLTLVMDKTYLA